MRSGLLVLLLVGGWVTAATGGPASPPTAVRPERIASLIDQLGSRQFKDREAASRELDALGAQALPALRLAAVQDDLEIRSRAQKLVRQIEKRIETAQVLAPKPIHLAFKDKPVIDAVAELAKDAGFPIQLDATTRSALAGRKITLNTGDTTFWEAFDQLCRQAGLVEPRQKSTPQLYNQYAGGPGFMMGTAYSGRQASTGPLALALGKPEILPTCYAGSVRIRMLSPKVPLVGHSKDEGETLFGLEVTPEPSMRWHGIVGMRVLKAIDQRGLSLSQSAVYVGESGYEGMMGNVVFFMDGSMMAPSVPKDPRQVPVHLQLRKTRSKMLKELTGTITARVESLPQPLITVDNILQATGRTAKGPDGRSLKILDVKTQPKGSLTIRVHLETFTGGWGGMMPWGGGFAMSGGPNGSHSSTWSLRDDKGQNLPLLTTGNQTTNFNGNSLVQELSLAYQPRKGHGKPVRLIYTGTRTLTIDVPFTLKNVPLP